jgi:hypothetical protein
VDGEQRIVKVKIANNLELDGERIAWQRDLTTEALHWVNLQRVLVRT